MVTEYPPGHCPLCSSGDVAFFHRDRRREYLRCEDCGLVFVPSRYFLPADAEKACYDRHQNNPADMGYRRFLDRLARPLIERLAPGARGLDFGSGPGPTLSLMLAEAGYPTAIYDPIYEPNAAVWDDEYDFITASEVVEHLHRPMLELQRLWTALKPGGWLGIMTKRVLNVTAFAKWHYKRDPTHVVFFSKETFIWLAHEWTAELQFIGDDVVFLQALTKPPRRDQQTLPSVNDSNLGATPGDGTGSPVSMRLR
jgi:SAM-dependent methyltransferase